MQPANIETRGRTRQRPWHEFPPDDGDPTRPATALGVAYESWARWDDRPLLLGVDGVLRAIDVASGASTPVLDDVRRFWLAPDGRRIVWEARGDDAVAVVRLRDLQTGADIVLPIDAPPDAGDWIFNADASAVAFRGDDGAFAAMFRADTGATIDVPEHVVGSSTAQGPDFDLQLPHPEDHVRVFWNPFSADPPIEWFRDPHVFGFGMVDAIRDGDVVLVAVHDICVPTRSMVHTDLRTGEQLHLLDDVTGPFIDLDDGRYLTAVDTMGGGGEVVDVILLVPDTGEQTFVASAVLDWSYRSDRGILILSRDEGPPGVHGLPVPPP